MAGRFILAVFKTATRLTALLLAFAVGGYYTTPEGMKAIGYVGNLPSGTFDGPSMEALKHVGLA